MPVALGLEPILQLSRVRAERPVAEEEAKAAPRSERSTHASIHPELLQESLAPKQSRRDKIGERAQLGSSEPFANKDGESGAEVGARGGEVGAVGRVGTRLNTLHVPLQRALARTVAAQLERRGQPVGEVDRVRRTHLLEAEECVGVDAEVAECLPVHLGQQQQRRPRLETVAATCHEERLHSKSSAGAALRVLLDDGDGDAGASEACRSVQTAHARAHHHTPLRRCARLEQEQKEEYFHLVGSRRNLLTVSSMRIPLVGLGEPLACDAGVTLLAALESSGFARVAAPDLVTPPLASAALARCAAVLAGPTAVAHPSDPKRYQMLSRCDLSAEDGALEAWWAAMDALKLRVLAALEEGLGVEHGLLTRRHSEKNDSLRLLCYPPVGLSEGNRCKEHSDYGSITLLLQDATGGLEVFDEHSGGWEAVPGEETRRDEAPRQAPTLILNAGSLLSLATNGAIKATKHRVPGPASIASRTDPAELRRAAAVSRHSLAFFVDPDATLRLELEARSGGEAAQGISVAEYVAWRCGKGDGVAYHPGEETS